MPRPKEAILSQSLIRDQALAIIDEDGLDALTMRRLADRLSVQAASLYTHFPNKEAVLDAIAERLAKGIDPAGFTDSWQAGLRTWANSYYAAIHWHPNAARVVAVGARGRNVDLAVVDQIHAGLVGHGWPAREAVLVTAAVRFLVLGAATTTAGNDEADSGVTAVTARRSRESSRSGPLVNKLDRASFDYALDHLIAGLETEYVRHQAKDDRSRSKSQAPPARSLASRQTKRPAPTATRKLGSVAGGSA